jgi:hypothetical protein
MHFPTLHALPLLLLITSPPHTPLFLEAVAATGARCIEIYLSVCPSVCLSVLQHGARVDLGCYSDELLDPIYVVVVFCRVTATLSTVWSPTPSIPLCLQPRASMMTSRFGLLRVTASPQGMRLTRHASLTSGCRVGGAAGCCCRQTSWRCVSGCVNMAGVWGDRLCGVGSIRSVADQTMQGQSTLGACPVPPSCSSCWQDRLASMWILMKMMKMGGSGLVAVSADRPPPIARCIIGGIHMNQAQLL